MQQGVLGAERAIRARNRHLVATWRERPATGRKVGQRAHALEHHLCIDEWLRSLVDDSSVHQRAALHAHVADIHHGALCNRTEAPAHRAHVVARAFERELERRRRHKREREAAVFLRHHARQVHRLRQCLVVAQPLCFCLATARPSRQRDRASCERRACCIDAATGEAGHRGIFLRDSDAFGRLHCWCNLGCGIRIGRDARCRRRHAWSFRNGGTGRRDLSSTPDPPRERERRSNRTRQEAPPPLRLVRHLGPNYALRAPACNRARRNAGNTSSTAMGEGFPFQQGCRIRR